MAPPNDSQAMLALVLGLVSVLCCVIGSIVGPVAIFVGNASRQRVAASNGTLGGGGLAIAGMILGILGTIILIGSIVTFISLIVSSGIHTSNP